MAYHATGRITVLGATVQVSEKFTKREFVLELSADNPKYPQLVQFQLTGDRVNLLDEFKIGDEVLVEFSLRGRKWESPRGEVKYFNSLDAWRIAHSTPTGKRDSAAPSTPPVAGGPAGADDDIPFASCSLDAEPSGVARALRGG